MCEIKFRYKIKNRNKLLYDTDDKFGYLQRKRKLIAGRRGEIFQVEDEMQYIGLKDKNIKEIYESDILQGSYLKIVNNGYGKAVDINVKGIVEFTDTAQFAIFTHKSKSGIKQYKYFSQLWPLSPDSYEIEIIGNMYENPETLGIWGVNNDYKKDRQI